MSKRTRIAAVGVAGLLGVAGLAVVTAPLASAATDIDGAVTSRLEAVREALAGLVGDGSITQEQADEVAATLDGSDALRGFDPHGHGHAGRAVDLGAAAEALGITTDELRTALGVEGTTLADVAAAEGVDLQTLVDALVASGEQRIDEAVDEGRLTQAEADEARAALPELVAEIVQEEPHLRGPGHGPHHGITPEEATTEDATTGGSTAAGSALLGPSV